MLGKCSRLVLEVGYLSMQRGQCQDVGIVCVCIVFMCSLRHLVGYYEIQEAGLYRWAFGLIVAAAHC